MRGRPSEFTPEIAAEICDRLSRGESLRKITADERDDFMPGETTVRRWLSGEEEWSAAFRRQYAQARDCQADHYAERIVDEAYETTDAQIGRLRMDALKWAASKLAPKKYGEKVQTEHSGTIRTERVERVVVDPSNIDS